LRKSPCASAQNDLDRTVVEEKFTTMLAAKTSEFTPRNELERLIRAAAAFRVERDTALQQN